jgi:hypothetical protein
MPRRPTPPGQYTTGAAKPSNHHTQVQAARAEQLAGSAAGDPRHAPPAARTDPEDDLSALAARIVARGPTAAAARRGGGATLMSEAGGDAASAMASFAGEQPGSNPARDMRRSHMIGAWTSEMRGLSAAVVRMEVAQEVGFLFSFSWWCRWLQRPS